ncbi:MAG: DUF721 domain-containing protein [Leptospiraceae bacterium]|nr:DUF721 domain-containing protein [Leptospiraceae bacterium]
MPAPTEENPDNADPTASGHVGKGDRVDSSVWNPWDEMDSRALPRKAPEPIASIQSQFRKSLEGFLGISEDESAFHSIQSQWSQLAGLLGHHTQPLSIQNGKLLVEVHQSVYAQELQLHSRNILKNIQKSLGVRLSGIQIRRAGFRK